MMFVGARGEDQGARDVDSNIRSPGPKESAASAQMECSDICSEKAVAAVLAEARKAHRGLHFVEHTQHLMKRGAL